MAKNKMTGNQLVILLLVGVIAVGAFYFAGQGGQATIVNDGKIPQQCDSTTTPQLDINAIDQENPGSTLTEATNLYRIKGQLAWSPFTQGTAFAANFGDTLEIVMGISTSDFTDNAYGPSFEYTVPCEETPTIERKLAQDEIETSLSATFFNADDNAAAETFSAGETQTVRIRLKAGTDEFFGNPFLPDNTPNVVCLTLNSSEWDKPEQVYLADGTNLNSVSTPDRLSATASFQDYCYEMPVIADRNVDIYMDLNADDSNAPSVDGTASMYAANWYINGDTSNLEYGVETEEDAAVGTDAADTVTLDFTA